MGKTIRFEGRNREIYANCYHWLVKSNELQNLYIEPTTLILYDIFYFIYRFKMLFPEKSISVFFSTRTIMKDLKGYWEDRIRKSQNHIFVCDKNENLFREISYGIYPGDDILFIIDKFYYEFFFRGNNIYYKKTDDPDDQDSILFNLKDYDDTKIVLFKGGL